MDSHQNLDTGLASLLMMAAFHGIAADEAQLKHEFGSEAFSADRLLLAAKKLGMKAKLVAQPPERLDCAPLPAIALDRSDGFFILAKYDPGTGGKPESASVAVPRLLIQHPGKPPAVINLEEFLASWSGQLIFLTSKANYAGEMANFDFSWFIPAIVKLGSHQASVRRSGTGAGRLFAHSFRKYQLHENAL